MPNPYIIGSNIFDQSQLALAGAADLSPEAMTRAVTDPGSLSPDERRKLSDRMGLSGPFAQLVDITTNPIVLVGLALAWKFKLPGAAESLTVKEGLQSVGRSVLPVLEKLAGPRYIFRGTKVPDLLDLAYRRHAEMAGSLYEDLTKAVHDYTSTYGKLTEQNWLRVGAALDGTLDPAGRSMSQLARFAPEITADLAQSRLTLTPGEQALADRFRATLDKGYAGVFEGATNKADVLRSMRALLGRGVGDEVAADAIQYEKNYWPRMSRKVSETEGPVSGLINRVVSGSDLEAATPDQVQGLVGGERRLAGDMTRGRAMARSGALMPEPDDLRALGAPRSVVDAAERWKTEVMGGRAYSLRAGEVLPRYADTLGRVYAFSLRTSDEAAPLGERLGAEVRRLYAAGDPNSRAKGQLLRDTYIPAILGRLTPGQYAAQLQYEQARVNLVQGLTEGRLGQVLPDSVKGPLTKWLTAEPGSFQGLGNRISSYFYLSTLGGNPVSATLNLLQPLATAAPTIGLKNLATGYGKVLRAIPDYAALRRSGLGSDAALVKLFPEFHAAHLELDPLSRQSLSDALEDSYKRSLNAPVGLRKGLRGLGEWLMLPFQSTETVNRLVTFYGSRAKALEELPGHSIYDAAKDTFVKVEKSNVGEWASEWARQNVARTQYGGGPLNKPAWALGWWSPLVQYTTFGSRTLGGLVNEGLDNPGQLGRALLYSGLAYGAVKESFGGDISRGLTLGGVPAPREGGVGAPFPFVPPIAQVAGAGLYALAGHGGEAVREGLPALVPGGAALARGAGFIPGVGRAASQATGQPYADYQNPLPDGRIPVYRSDGGLIGYDRPSAMLARAMGIVNPTVQHEQAVMQMILKNQERITEYKRNWMQAWMEGDAWDMQSIADKFEHAYPGVDFPVTDADIHSLHVRRDVSRIERAMQSLPAEVRPQMAATVSMAIGRDYPQFLGLAQEGLSEGQTYTEREPFRYHTEEMTKAKLGTSLHGVKLSDKLRQAGIERGRGDQSGLNDPFANAFGQMSPSGGELNQQP